MQRGFATVYSVFSYPDRKRMRVSQVLVLPPFQRQGVGRALLQSVYALADSHNALDVTVRPCTRHCCNTDRGRGQPRPALRRTVLQIGNNWQTCSTISDTMSGGPCRTMCMRWSTAAVGLRVTMRSGLRQSSVSKGQGGRALAVSIFGRYTSGLRKAVLQHCRV